MNRYSLTIKSKFVLENHVYLCQSVPYLNRYPRQTFQIVYKAATHCCHPAKIKTKFVFTLIKIYNIITCKYPFTHLQYTYNLVYIGQYIFSATKKDHTTLTFVRSNVYNKKWISYPCVNRNTHTSLSVVQQINYTSINK